MRVRRLRWIVPLHWVFFVISLFIQSIGVIAMGPVGLAIRVVLFMFAAVDHMFLITPIMKNSSDKALKRKLDH